VRRIARAHLHGELAGLEFRTLRGCGEPLAEAGLGAETADRFARRLAELADLVLEIEAMRDAAAPRADAPPSSGPSAIVSSKRDACGVPSVDRRPS